MKKELFRLADKRYDQNLSVMKTLLTFLILSVSFSIANGQRSIDALFRKYSDKDGYVVLTASGNILKNLSVNCRNRIENSKPWNISEIRILTEEEKNDKSDKDSNFYDVVMKDINTSEYEEFMRINRTDQNMVIMVKTAGRRIKEFLLVGGGNENVLIQIKGDISFEEAEELASDMEANRGDNLSVFSN